MTAHAPIAIEGLEDRARDIASEYHNDLTWELERKLEGCRNADARAYARECFEDRHDYREDFERFWGLNRDHFLEQAREDLAVSV